MHAVVTTRKSCGGNADGSELLRTRITTLAQHEILWRGPFRLREQDFGEIKHYGGT